MTTQLKFCLSMTAAALILLASRAASAQDAPATATASAQNNPLSGLFDLLGSNALPSLAGLIQPEKMGVLTDNPCTVRENEADIDLLSENEMNVLSGNHLFSGITVHIQIHVGRERSAAERQADKANREKKAAKTPKRKSDRRARQ